MSPDLITLAEAAEKLGCNYETLRLRAPSIPGAFKCGGWRLPANIIEVMQNARGPALRTSEEPCQSVSEESKASAGFRSPRQVESALDDRLEQLTGPKRRNTKTRSERKPGK